MVAKSSQEFSEQEQLLDLSWQAGSNKYLSVTEPEAECPILAVPRWAGDSFAPEADTSLSTSQQRHPASGLQNCSSGYYISSK